MSYRSGGRPPYGGYRRPFGAPSRNSYDHPSEKSLPAPEPNSHTYSHHYNDGYYSRNYDRANDRVYQRSSYANEAPPPYNHSYKYNKEHHTQPADGLSRSSLYDSRPKPVASFEVAEPIDEFDCKQLPKHYDYSKFSEQNHHISKSNRNDSTLKQSKGFKIIYDPELKKDPLKGSKPIYEYVDFKSNTNDLPPVDPRTPSHPNYEKSHKRGRRVLTSIPVPRFKYDKYSIGPKPTNEIVIWNFPSTTSLLIIRNNFTRFGKISEIHGTDDPDTAVPLGICKLSFDGDAELAHVAASNAAKKSHKQIRINGAVIQCGLNTNNVLYETVYKKTLEIKRMEKKKEDEKRQRELEIQKQKERLKVTGLPRGPAKTQRLDDPKQKASTPPPPPSSSIQSIRTSQQPAHLLALSDILAGNKNTAEGNGEQEASTSINLSSHDRHIKPLSSYTMPLNFDKFIGNRCFIFIPDKYVSTRDVNSSDVRKVLSKYNCDRILTHKSGFFVIFNSLKDAEKCFDMEDGRKFLNYKMYMELVVPDELMSQTKIADKIGVVSQAKSSLLKEFHNYLLKDLREKIIGPRLLQKLNGDKYTDILKKYQIEQDEIKKKQKEDEQGKLKLKEQLQTQIPKPIGINGIHASHQTASITSLSSFRRRRDSLESPAKAIQRSKSKMNAVPMAHALNFSDHDDSSEEEDEDEEESDERESTPISSDATPKPVTLKRKPSLEIKKVPALKKQKLVEKAERQSDEDEDDLMTVAFKSNTTSQPTSPETANKQIFTSDVKEIDLKGVAAEEEQDSDMDEEEDQVKSESEEDDVPTDFSGVDQMYRPSPGTPQPVYVDDFKMMDYDLEDLQNIIKDDEDLRLAKLAVSDMKPSTEIKDISYWAWKQNSIKNHTKLLLNESKQKAEETEILAFEDEIINNEKLQNDSGSFRAQGYHKIPDKLKSEYLLHRRKANKPLNTVQHDDEGDAGSQANNIYSSRVNRANNRRFAADISAQKQMLGSETDILDLNQLTKRKKPVQFARSAIHNWGLYALEPIAAREMIIEYVGDRIRQQVAEVREKKYLRSGIGSSYLFRIDENTVIDASKKGGIARFINHCCVPSCTAKIIKVEGKKRIVIYALRDIGANEELTYDYKFERETNDDERIPCLCGAVGCKGYL
ncbi:hypothetical protein CANARDRAFT_28758, partial [[Candida] arabinofermentans NRRL YB-2248]